MGNLRLGKFFKFVIYYMGEQTICQTNILKTFECVRPNCTQLFFSFILIDLVLSINITSIYDKNCILLSVRIQFNYTCRFIIP